MKSKKSIIVTLLVIVIIAGLVIAGFFVHRIMQEQKLVEEVNAINSLDLLTAEVDMTIKTTGDYAVVEQTMKDYMKSAQETMKNLNNIYLDETVVNSLSPDNLKNDGPAFENTKAAVTNAREKAATYAEEVNKYLDDEYIKSLIQDKGLSDYYIDLYNKLMFEDQDTMQDMENTQKELVDANGKYVNMLDKIEQVIALLSENPNAWNVTDDGQVEFYSQTVLDQYNAYVTEIKSVE